MTTANLLNISSVKVSQADVSKKLQEENREVTEMFASMMNQTVDAVNQAAGDTSSQTGFSKEDSAQAITDSYERYSYKDNQIENAKDKEISAEEMEAAGETLEQAEKEILDTISKEYAVDEETLRSLLDEMGLSALDLLSPKNLVSVVMALTGTFQGEELLLDENFLKVMETLDVLSNDLMKNLNVDMKGLQDMIAQMETMNLESAEVTFDKALEAQMDNLNAQETTDAANPNQTEQVGETAQQEALPQENSSEAVKADDGEAEDVKIQVSKQGEAAETKADNAEVIETAADTEADADSSLFGRQSTGGDSLFHQENSSGQVFMTNQAVSAGGQVGEMSQMQLSSYFSVDTAQIMEQIAEQIKVAVTPDTTSMEMQLNPENLGRIYLHISSEEGVVNAQFIATNDVVKEALEAQVSILRENLTQAGVKVDAIEVTIASHEFERNLEQNQQSPQEQIQEDAAPRRRNLTVDSLDELQGIMTEEETLAAQIMKDNGNTIDFTA